MKSCCKAILDRCNKEESDFYSKYPNACRKCGGSGIGGYYYENHGVPGIGEQFTDPCRHCEDRELFARCGLCAEPLDDGERVCDCSYDTFLWTNTECGDCIAADEEEAERMYQLWINQ
jgi:hypothetical protein